MAARRVGGGGRTGHPLTVARRHPLRRAGDVAVRQSQKWGLAGRWAGRHPLRRAGHVIVRQAQRWGVGITWAGGAGPGAGSPAVPSPLRGEVDAPAPGAAVSNEGFRVRGWSAWGPQPALAVAVSVDGVVVARGAVGTLDRPDVADATESPVLAGAGWSIDVPAESIPAVGGATVSVVVWGEQAGPGVELDAFAVDIVEGPVFDPDEVVPPAFVGVLEKPRPDTPVGSVLEVRGWVVHADEPVSRLDVVVNGRSVGPARLGLARFDISPEHRGPEARMCGFEQFVDLSSVPDPARPMKVQVVARAAGEEPTVWAETLVGLAPEPAPREERAARDGTLAARRESLVGAAATAAVADLHLVAFTHQLDYGGGQLWLDELLQRSGAGTAYACTVIAFRDGALRASMEHRGIDVHVTGLPPVDDFEAYEGRITELCALTAHRGPNVALVNTAPAFAGADVAARLALPTVWAVHESWSPDVLLTVAYGDQVDPNVRDVARRVMSGADAVVFEAESTRALFGPWVDPDHSVVVPYGVDTAAIGDYCARVSRRQARADVGVPPEARLLLVMGTVGGRKAQTRITQAFARVRHEHPDTILAFVGVSDPAYGFVLRDYVEAHEMEDQVWLLPVDHDANRWYRAADLLLSASDVESLPRSMLEAMCFETPIVSTSVFGVPELLTDGATGFLFEPNDLDALIAALRRVLSLSAAELGAVGEAGSRLARRAHDSSGYAHDFMALFEGLRSAPGTSPREILSAAGRAAPTNPRAAGSPVAEAEVEVEAGADTNVVAT